MVNETELAIWQRYLAEAEKDVIDYGAEARKRLAGQPGVIARALIANRDRFRRIVACVKEGKPWVEELSLKPKKKRR